MSFFQLKSPFTGNRNIAGLTVTTQAVSDITSTTATGNGTLVDMGTSYVTTLGICWSTNPNPTTSDSTGTAIVAMGAYTVSMTSLSSSTTYYVRAYAINGDVTAYGEEVSFATSGAGAAVYVPMRMMMGMGM